MPGARRRSVGALMRRARGPAKGMLLPPPLHPFLCLQPSARPLIGPHPNARACLQRARQPLPRAPTPTPAAPPTRHTPTPTQHIHKPRCTGHEAQGAMGYTFKKTIVPRWVSWSVSLGVLVRHTANTTEASPVAHCNKPRRRRTRRALRPAHAPGHTPCVRRSSCGHTGVALGLGAPPWPTQTHLLAKRVLLRAPAHACGRIL